MFTKEETAAGKKAFWTAFGKYMQPVPGADGAPKKWMNYETGVSGLYLRIFLQNNTAFAGIEIADADSEQGCRLVDKLIQTMPLLERLSGTGWDWITLEDRPSRSLFWGRALLEKNPLLQSHWPELVSFFKQQLLFLDSYWNETGFIFEI